MSKTGNSSLGSGVSSLGPSPSISRYFFSEITIYLPRPKAGESCDGERTICLLSALESLIFNYGILEHDLQSWRISALEAICADLSELPLKPQSFMWSFR